MRINKLSGYYEGPDGVFYDFKHNEIFELIYDGCEIYRKNVGIVGKRYKYKTTISRTRNAVLTGMTNVIRLGAI